MLIRYYFTRYKYWCLGLLFVLFVSGIFLKSMNGKIIDMYVNAISALLVLGIMVASYRSDKKKKNEKDNV